MHYILRNSKDSDREWLDSLRRLVYRELFNTTWGGWDEAKHAEHFEDCWQRGCIQLIEMDGSPIGMIQLHDLDDRIEVGEIQISPAHQNKGVGTQVLVDLIERVREGQKDVVLSAGLKNTRAIRLYARLGFKVVKRSETHVYMRHRAASK